jgi:SMC interacting uncharacterized protein involved in chromosome segregation
MSEKKQLSQLKKIPEIRVRDVTPDTAKTLIDIGAVLKTRTVPDTITAMIRRFKSDQSNISQLQARNSELHRKIAKYVESESDFKNLLRAFVEMTNRYNKLCANESKLILRKLTGTKKRPAGQPAKSPGSRIVPVKKAAGKKKAIKQGRLL